MSDRPSRLRAAEQSWRAHAANAPRFRQAPRVIHPADWPDSSARMPWWTWPLGAALFAVFAAGWV